MQKSIDWSFNPPGASHHGEIWERQIKSVRKQLNAICQEQLLTDESLITLMCKVEAIINSRPLTTVSNDPDNLEPLTPNHFLLMKTNSFLPPGVFDPTDIYSRKQWIRVQYLAYVFGPGGLRNIYPHFN